MRKNTQECYDHWLRGKRYSAKSGAISTDGTHIYSYEACIVAKQDDTTIVFNATKYTPTTTQQQNGLRALLFDFPNILNVTMDGSRHVRPDQLLVQASRRPTELERIMRWPA